MKQLSVTRLIFITAFLMAFISPPFFLGQFTFLGREIRLLVGLVSILLIISLVYKIQVYDIYLLACVIFFLVLEIFRGLSELNNILSYYTLIIFYLMLYIALRNREVNRQEYLKLWVQIGYFMSFASIVVFFIHQFTSLNTDFLNFASLGDFSARDVRFSILGETQNKRLYFISLARSCAYFAEPQYAGLYFTINILLSGDICKDGRYNKWLPMNLLAGLLTFSTTFYVGMALIYLVRIASKRNKFQFALMTTVVMVIVLPLFVFSEDIVSGLIGGGAGGINSSYSDREMRMLTAVNILRSSSVFEYFFGHGVGYTANAEHGLASGFFHVIVERGITGFLFVIVMQGIFLGKNLVRNLILFLYFFAFTWYVNYIFWMGILVLWVGDSISKLSLLDRKDSELDLG